MMNMLGAGKEEACAGKGPGKKGGLDQERIRFSD